ncbi:TPA: toprim domain-containing protein, partial [Escherichia coli]|nr:toprim domain-containing protein [Escherichia coli]
MLGCLNINVPDSPRRHAPCPACGGKDRFRFDDNGRGSFICNQCGAGDGLDLIKRVNNCDTTEAALLAADVLGIDYRTTETPEATSQKREQLETERQRREQERLKRAEKDEQQRRDTFSRQFDDMRRKAVNGKSDYLVAKGVGDFTFPVLPDGSLLLALVDKSGAVTAAQTITSHGEKRLLTGSAKRGAYHAINAPETTQSILIAEGLATALSAHLIRPEALTVAAIDAGNLLYVAQVLRDKFPSAQIIIAADNDHSEGRQNTGRIAAEKAALSVSGWVALPPTDHKADWNDYHQKHGIK